MGRADTPVRKVLNYASENFAQTLPIIYVHTVVGMKDDGELIVLAPGVMGQNLVLNMNDHGYSVAVYNRTTKKVDDFLNGSAFGRESITGAHDLASYVERWLYYKKCFPWKNQRSF